MFNIKRDDDVISKNKQKRNMVTVIYFNYFSKKLK